MQKTQPEPKGGLLLVLPRPEPKPRLVAASPPRPQPEAGLLVRSFPCSQPERGLLLPLLDLAPPRPQPEVVAGRGHIPTGCPKCAVTCDFEFCVPPSCPAAQLLLPNSHQPKQSWAENGTLEIQAKSKTVLASHQDAHLPLLFLRAPPLAEVPLEDLAKRFHPSQPGDFGVDLVRILRAKR